MYIKIYSKSQFNLLKKSMRYFKKKYMIPNEVMNKVYEILSNSELGNRGYIVIIMQPLVEDMQEIEEILDYYPQLYECNGDLINVDIDNKKTKMTQSREWYLDILEDKVKENYIYVLYSMNHNVVYKKEYISDGKL